MPFEGLITPKNHGYAIEVRTDGIAVDVAMVSSGGGIVQTRTTLTPNEAMSLIDTLKAALGFIVTR